MVDRTVGVGREKVRAALGLAVWEVELAAETGLLRRLPDRSFEAASVRAALDDPGGFRQGLAQERRCNATESAARLGISVQRFKRVAAATGLVPVAGEDVRKYGRVLRVVYYRAGDVDALADHVQADVELRAAAVAVSREQAAQKAAVTRKRNAELRREARTELESRKPADAEGIEKLRWAVALMRTAGRFPAPLRRLAHVEDAPTGQLAHLMRQARLREDELAAMLEDVLPRAARATEGLADPDQVSAMLGVSAWLVSQHVPHFGGHVPVPALRELAGAPPPWLLAAWADIEFQRASVEVVRQDEKQREAVLDTAERAASRLSDAGVAELLGLSKEVVRRLRPGTGRWKAAYVEQLLRRRPAWSLSEEAAWAEAERCRRRRERREQRRGQRKPG
ncbi:hypothetical protein ACQPZP_28615 [Spirillospora sp. CA-142024]|uniref:hypothetical protein n=1 Tax=Spirillospora sp. CA-142024 TaxID=3240036 RepID=UPI003D94818F